MSSILSNMLNKHPFQKIGENNKTSDGKWINIPVLVLTMVAARDSTSSADSISQLIWGDNYKTEEKITTYTKKLVTQIVWWAQHQLEKIYNVSEWKKKREMSKI